MLPKVEETKKSFECLLWALAYEFFWVGRFVSTALFFFQEVALLGERGVSHCAEKKIFFDLYATWTTAHVFRY